MQNKVFGLDLAKSVFHAVDQHGQPKKLRRHTLLTYFARQEKILIAMAYASLTLNRPTWMAQHENLG